MASQITYEQPLTERVRNFLRTEHLFDLVLHFRRGGSDSDSRMCLVTLLEIVDLLGRSDVKTELIKELERHAGTLTSLAQNPGVDQERLQAVLSDINHYLSELRDSGFQPGQMLRKDELVQSIKQRNAIPGGTCTFDLPAYHHWLHRAENERRADLDNWLKDLDVIRKGVKLALHMTRNSTRPTQEQAAQGFFQKPIDSNSGCQLVRVVLPGDSAFFPEISGGRHRFTIRFMQQQQTNDRPVQTGETVDFELHCCVL